VGAVGLHVDEQVGQQGGHVGVDDAVVDAHEAVGAGAAVVDHPHEAVAAFIGARHDGHEASARVGGRLGQRGDVAHVVGPGEGPLHQEEGREGSGRPDRIDALGVGPRGAAEVRVSWRSQLLDDVGHEGQGRRVGLRGGAGVPCRRKTNCSRAGEAGPSPALTRSRRSGAHVRR
jgi:hypothetical protein